MAWHTDDKKKSFTNRDAAKSYEKRMGSVKEAVGGGQKAEFGNEGGDWGEEEENDPHQIVENHGPAHVVHIEHQHEANQHHVHSEHPDGHVHESDHASAEEAHEHGKKLAGCDMGMDDEREEGHTELGE